MRLANLIFLALSCVATCATAQVTNNVRSLSLRDSIDLALRDNLDLRIERANTDIARHIAQGANGVFDPNFFLEASHHYDNMPLYFVPDKANPDFGYKADSEVFGSGFKGKLPVGGLTYDLGVHSINFHNVRTDFNLTPEQLMQFPNSADTAADFPPNGIRTTRDYYMEAGLTLRQPLLKNSWIDLDRQQILINKNHLQMSEVTLRGVIIQKITAIQLAYYDLIYARENVVVERQAVELGTNLLAVTKAKVQAGALTPLDQSHAESHLETVQSDLLSAQLAFLEQQNVLKQYITDNFGAWRDIEIYPTDDLRAVPDGYVRDLSFLNALTKRPDILQAKLNLERHGIVLKYNYNQLYPSLDLELSGGGRSADPSFGKAAGDIGDLSHPFYRVGAILSFPLGNRSARHSYEASKIAEKQALLQMQKLESEVLAQVDTAAKTMETTYKRVQATRGAREFAQKALEVAQIRLQEGTVVSFIVMEAQKTLTTARSAEIRALADYNKALAQLAYAEGMTIEKNNLRLDFK